MPLCNNITAKVLVWLAAISVPAETLPVMACNCGSHPPQRAEAKSSRAAETPAAKCSHCAARSQPRHSCCGSTAATLVQHGSCCGAEGSCCCKGGLGSHGGPCQCSAKHSDPVPNPLPGDSRTDNTKPSLSPSSLAGMTTAAILPLAVLGPADQQPTLLGSSAPERLSVLCRLVI